MIRKAQLQDLSSLVEIENTCFEVDRFSRRSFRYLLTRANAETLVDEQDGLLAGYVTVLFHTGTSLARLYSLAVLPKARGRGIGGALIKAAEEAALANDCVVLRLEVRRDNTNTIRLYEKLGYRLFGKHIDYYEDHMDALRYEKYLAPQLKPELVRVPYYKQTLDFTCGPAAVMMAMKALDPNLNLSRKLELRLWRESTTVYMTSGHGGCGPYGMALAVYHMGFDVEVHVNGKAVMFLDSVRSEEKKEVMQLVQEDFVAELKELPVKIRYGGLSVAAIQEKFEAGKLALDSINMPIPKKDFDRMARYGKAGQKAVLVVRRRAEQQKSAAH